MAYVYICDKCRAGDHEHCEVQRDRPGIVGVAGGGHCVCSHGEEKDRGKFEQSVWERS